MKKSTKGALAAGAAGTLLLGGAGSLAYWTQMAPISGVNISSGHLALTGAGCGGWKFNGGADYSAQKIVPGDTLTNSCTYTASMQGDNLNVELSVSSTPSLTGDAGLIAALSGPTADYTIGGTPVTSFPATVTDGQTITALITVSFPSGATGGNSASGVSAALAGITVTASQV